MTISSYLQYDFDLGDQLLGIVRLEHSFIDDTTWTRISMRTW